jgi:hypothetical protein
MEGAQKIAKQLESNQCALTRVDLGGEQQIEGLDAALATVAVVL